ncbi:YbjN domain-containing protein [Celeribacter sp.]|uniref:YbjN domain-containing protein n=1 Tax=Celeribacter sp. TaxID=1890673 RepID=UPI003A8FBE87
MLRPLTRTAMLAATLALGLATAPHAAQAQALITFDDLDAFEYILDNYGSVTRDIDSEGDPMFSGTIDGLRYMMHFYGCDGASECNNATFTAFFDGADYKTDLRTVNAFNEEHRFGKASVDEDGDLKVNYSFTFLGGLTYDTLDDTVDWWRVILEQVDEFFG